MRKLGISPAWSRERFTMDEGLKKAVKKAFVKLYDEGLIVRGNYMVNWCTHDGALSDIEVEYEENHQKLYYLKYPLKNSNDFITVATTRPETFFGDTAVMVNPSDERYKDYIGKSVILPLVGKEIKIIADFLEFVTVFDEKGILNKFAGEFEGVERLEARDKVIAKLQEKGFVEKIEDYVNQVGHCYRCKNIVEPYISKQWFIKKEIANNAIRKTNEGEVSFYPSHWLNSYNAWMCDKCGHEWASEKDEQKNCPKCDSREIHQDPDVLDTWFSSGLWPFSTLGWGNGDEFKNIKWFENDLKDFYPNSILITGFDILFFWVARMMFS